ncbi:MAG: LysR family transcriptional regulator [Vibrio metschnikovii]|uniref:LysR family transcriptional regulator n=1 Tax=Vibrio metschnikovii TaxID=28172 RepID=A0A9X0R799_VIBME|nr:LysR family transcriptional regulator [Vibrio metschnikovii]MBC5849435.1 LysR family transcriptional regulator [Vibrio metschnikovii]MDM7483571.1 LysR family transcriptional regulator [Vibrio metschnikovii]
MHDLSAIKAFHALCQHKSLTAAAKALEQPKSTLSRRLAMLESDLGQALITRQGNRLTLTKAGQVFAVYTEQLLELASKGIEALQELNNQISGNLTLVVHPNLVRGWISHVLDEFMLAHPEVTIRVHSHYVAENSLLEPDLMIWIGAITPSGWRRELLGNWHYSPYASPNYLATHPKPEHPEQLINHTWIDFIACRQEGLTLTHPTQGDWVLPALKSRLQSDSLAMQADAIAKGRGIGLLPTWFAEGFERAHPGSLAACLPEWLSPPSEVACYYPAGRHPLRLRLFIDALRHACPNEWKTA